MNDRDAPVAEIGEMWWVKLGDALTIQEKKPQESRQPGKKMRGNPNAAKGPQHLPRTGCDPSRFLRPASSNYYWILI